VWPRQAARMAVRELNYETIRGRVPKPMHAVRAEILILPLSPSATTGAYGFEQFNGISNRIFIERSEVRILTDAFCDSLDRSKSPGILPLGSVGIAIGAGVAIPTALAQHPSRDDKAHGPFLLGACSHFSRRKRRNTPATPRGSGPRA
jgi:hypothetical protein